MSNMSQSALKHAGIVTFIFVIAFAVNASPYFLTGVSPIYNLSSDATVHEADWQEFSHNYSGNFTNDSMFQNEEPEPTGVLFGDKLLVELADTFGINLLWLSVIISTVSLGLFLSGVYVLVLYSLKNSLLTLTITLISIIPVISLDGSSWGFLVSGFAPKELGLGIVTWLSLLYLWGVATDSKPKIAAFFVMLGLCSNWYPPLFFYYALVLITAEVIRSRSIRLSHIFYGMLFLVAAPVALFDIFRAIHFSPPIVSVIYSHYTWPLHSWHYLFFNYLRKQIVYAFLVAVLYYIYRHIIKKEYPSLVLLWYAIWWSTLIWSLVGVDVELSAPLYTKFLLGRTSVWFYAASMIIVAYTAHEIYFAKFRRSLKHILLFFALLCIVLVSQTSVISTYSGIRYFRYSAQNYRGYITVATKIYSLVPPGSIVLANPNAEANTIRAYGEVGTFVAAKDGNIVLFDGSKAALWYRRYKDTEYVFNTKDFVAIQNFGAQHSVQYYLFNTKDIATNTDKLRSATIFSSGAYGIAKLY